MIDYKENKNMDLNNMTLNNGLGNTVYKKLYDSKKQEIIEIIFTKGKLELNVEEVLRINVYENSMHIFLKENQSIFVNLYTVTTIT